MTTLIQSNRIHILLERMGAGREALAEVDPAWEDYENQDWATADAIIGWLERALVAQAPASASGGS